MTLSALISPCWCHISWQELRQRRIFSNCIIHDVWSYFRGNEWWYGICFELTFSDFQLQQEYRTADSATVINYDNCCNFYQFRQLSVRKFRKILNCQLSNIQRSIFLLEIFRRTITATATTFPCPMKINRVDYKISFKDFPLSMNHNPRTMMRRLLAVKKIFKFVNEKLPIKNCLCRV